MTISRPRSLMTTTALTSLALPAVMLGHLRAGGAPLQLNDGRTVTGRSSPDPVGTRATDRRPGANAGHFSSSPRTPDPQA